MHRLITTSARDQISPEMHYKWRPPPSIKTERVGGEMNCNEAILPELQTHTIVLVVCIFNHYVISVNCLLDQCFVHTQRVTNDVSSRYRIGRLLQH